MAQELITWDTVNIGTGATLSNGNLTAVVSGTVSTVRATRGKMVGKWYWEVKVDVVGYALIGIVNKDTSLSVSNFTQLTTKYYYHNGNKYAGATAYGASYTTGDTISVLLDLDIGTIEFYKNGVSQGVAFTDVKTLGEVFPAITNGSGGSNTTTTNFGAIPFTYAIPSGYLPYNRYDANKVLFASDDGKVRSIKPQIISDSTSVPKMTSNTAPNGLAFSSTSHPSYLPYMAFDRVDNSYGWLSVSGTTIGHIGYEFTESKKIVKYAVRSSNGVAQLETLAKDWTFEGSNDGFVWHILDKQINQVSATVSTDKEYVISNTKYYKMYRLNITANSGSTTYVSVQELKLFEELSNKKIVQIPSQSEQSFINHGISQSDLASVDIYSDFTEKNYIQDVTTVLGSGKVFEHALDINKTLKKIKIK